MDNFDEARTATENMFTATEEAPVANEPKQVEIEAPAVEETVEETTEETTEGEATEEATEEVAAEEAPLVESEAASEATEEATEAVEETVAPEEEAKDANAPLDEYTAEELYQYTKKRLIEEFGLTPKESTDGCAEDSAEEVEEEKEEDEEEEVVADHAPRIPVTMNGTPAAKGSLADMYNTLKEGGR